MNTVSPDMKKKIASLLIIAAIVIGALAYIAQSTKTTSQAINQNDSDVQEIQEILNSDAGEVDATGDTHEPNQADDATAPDYYQRDSTPTEIPGSNKYSSSNLFDETHNSPREPSSAEVATVATERGVMLYNWELGSVQQKEQMMKSYPVYDYDEYPDNKWLSWKNPAPGMTILMRNPDTGQNRKCTLGAFVKGPTQTYAVTAGHCAQGGFNEVYYKLSNEPNVRPFGAVQFWQVMGKPTPQDIFDFGTDATFIRVNPEVAPTIDSRIAGEVMIESYANPAELKPGMEVCKMGYRTQESCGVVIASNDSMVRTHMFGLQGDSGSPLYAYTDKGSKKAMLIGFLSSSPKAGNQTHDFIVDYALTGPLIKKTNGQVMGGE